MSESVHGDVSSPTPAEGGGDVKVEHLLLAGLDHYFKGQYQRAIDVWSRVLFLDRSHARARAYIERARAALAERSRESEELLHTGVEAFERGDVGEARALLTSAAEQGGGRDDALAMLDRLQRLEGTAGQVSSGAEGGRRSRPLLRRRPATGIASDPRVRMVPLALLLFVLAATAIVLLVGRPFAGRVLQPPGVLSSVPAVGARDPLPVPTTAELAVARASRFVADGRDHDALRLLETIAPGDSLRSSADVMRAEIQQRLLSPAGGERGQAEPARP